MWPMGRRRHRSSTSVSVGQTNKKQNRIKKTRRKEEKFKHQRTHSNDFSSPAFKNKSRDVCRDSAVTHSELLNHNLIVKLNARF